MIWGVKRRLILHTARVYAVASPTAQQRDGQARRQVYIEGVLIARRGDYYSLSAATSVLRTIRKLRRLTVEPAPLAIFTIFSGQMSLMRGCLQ